MRWRRTSPSHRWQAVRRASGSMTNNRMASVRRPVSEWAARYRASARAAGTYDHSTVGQLLADPHSAAVVVSRTAPPATVVGVSAVIWAAPPPARAEANRNVIPGNRWSSHPERSGGCQQDGKLPHGRPPGPLFSAPL